MATNPSNDRRIAPSERRERERKGRDTGQFDGTLRASSVGRGSPWPMSPFDGIFVKGSVRSRTYDTKAGGLVGVGLLTPGLGEPGA